MARRPILRPRTGPRQEQQGIPTGPGPGLHGLLNLDKLTSHQVSDYDCPKASSIKDSECAYMNIDDRHSDYLRTQEDSSNMNNNAIQSQLSGFIAGSNGHNEAEIFNPLSLCCLCEISVRKNISFTFTDDFLKTCRERSVVNLSSYQLSDAEMSVLQKGLTFCPTPGEPNTGDLK